MAKKVKRISRQAKQKFSPGLLYLILSLAVLILIAVFVNTSKISKEPKAGGTGKNINCTQKYSKKKYKVRLCNATCGWTKTTDVCNARFGWTCCIGER